mmetsp:Transcript_3514/g.14556  ORF Transcript_3514/g.14556 Transcript_3514/m.14556 type:complete len:254 (+) Transcript_3514:2147-2908(+)
MLARTGRTTTTARTTRTRRSFTPSSCPRPGTCWSSPVPTATSSTPWPRRQACPRARRRTCSSCSGRLPRRTRRRPRPSRSSPSRRRWRLCCAAAAARGRRFASGALLCALCSAGSTGPALTRQRLRSSSSASPSSAAAPRASRWRSPLTSLTRGATARWTTCSCGSSSAPTCSRLASSRPARTLCPRRTAAPLSGGLRWRQPSPCLRALLGSKASPRCLASRSPSSASGTIPAASSQLRGWSSLTSPSGRHLR